MTISLKPEALVLVPGLMSDAGIWQAQIVALQTRIPIIVIDHGELDSLMAMAENVLDHAPAKFALAGHSMGGRVVLEVMRQQPERVTHLALIDTACHAPTNAEALAKESETRFGFLKIAQEQGLDRMARLWVQNMVYRDHLRDEQLIGNIASMFARQSVAKYAAQINALLNRAGLFPVLKMITCPTLVLCGREDASTTVAVHQEMMTALPNATLVIVEHCGHMSMLEQPDAVTNAMRAWLEK
jgi:pimeloyl-ACP methyl ester carboxylesterase